MDRDESRGGHVSYDEVLERARNGQAVCADSRKAEEGAIFVAVPGASEDGAKYARDARSRGASIVVLDKSRAGDGLDDWLVGSGVLVAHHESPRLALSELAAAHYRTADLGLTVLGVTGTNGKTTCAYLLEALLQSQGHATGVLGTVSYRWPGHDEPAPLTTPGPLEVHASLAAMAKAGATHCVMEVSSHALSQERVAHVPFAGAAFTNLTQDHLDFHADMEDYFRAKARLFTDTPLADKAVATNADDPHGLRLAALCPSAFTYGFCETPAGVAPDHHLKGTLLEHGTSGVGLAVTCGNRSWELHSKLIGRFNADNLLTVQALCLALGMDPADFRALESFPGVPGRVERVDNALGLHVFVDYAHTPDALVNVQRALRGAGFKRLVTVFGCGGNRDRAKRPLMGGAVAELSDVCVLTSDNPRFEDPEAIIADVMPGLAKAKETLIEPDRREATRRALELLGPDDCLLVAGKGHEDYQIVQGVKRHYSDRETVIWLAAELAAGR